MLTTEPSGSGLGTTDQDVPSHDCTRVWPRLPWVPTATQSVGSVHDTASRALPPLAGSGLGTADHDAPSQDSTRVRRVGSLPVASSPTATQKSGPVHET